MRQWVNLGIILAFSICYMEWGKGQTAFIAETEYILLVKEKSLLASLTHPLILAGLVGQLILLYAAFSQKPSKLVNHLGVLLLAVIVIFVLLAGLLSVNIRMIASVIPFIGLTLFYFLRVHKK